MISAYFGLTLIGNPPLVLDNMKKTYLFATSSNEMAFPNSMPVMPRQEFESFNNKNRG